MLNPSGVFSSGDRQPMRELDQVFRLSEKPVFNIKAVEQATGVLASTLRAWERRYHILAPKRTESGYRLYSERDIAIVRWLKGQLDQGMTISHAATLLESRLNEGAPPVTPVIRVVESAPLVELQRELLDALLRLDEMTANQLLGEAFGKLTVETVCLKVIAPILWEIGDRWSRGEANVAQEHFASHYIRQRLMALMAATGRRNIGRPIVTASAPTDQHEIGILFIALFLQRAGFDVIHLGVNLAGDGLADTLSAIRPGLVAISATHEEAALHIADIAREIEKMSDPRPVLGYGGQVFNDNPALRATTPGVFLGRTADETVETVERLLRPIHPR